MRCLIVCLGMVGALSAQAPLWVVSVERRGLPPYEREDRVYRLDGGMDRGLRVGRRLMVKRVGEVQAFGHFWVTEIWVNQAVARFEPLEDLYPMKGDLAILEVMKWVPEPRRLNTDRLPLLPAPRSTAPAPPREGVLFFLPMSAELSLAGVKKLETWVEEWGAKGRWVIQVPAAKAMKPALKKHRVEAMKPALQAQRAEALLAALRALGIQQVKLETDPRTLESKYDPTWIRHWD